MTVFTGCVRLIEPSNRLKVGEIIVIGRYTIGLVTEDPGGYSQQRVR